MLRTYDDHRTDAGTVVHRSFCSMCGSSLFITNDANPMLKDAVIVSTGTMNLPRSAWSPDQEFYCKRRRDWIPRVIQTQKWNAME